MAKRIVFEEEARKALLKGIDAVADAVKLFIHTSWCKQQYINVVLSIFPLFVYINIISHLCIHLQYYHPEAFPLIF